MTSYEIAHLLEKLGVRETKAETYPNTYSLVNSDSFLAQQVSNRDSASWKKAEYIILTDMQVSQGILNGWKKLTERDPLPRAIQKLCVPTSGNQFDVYDSQGNLIKSDSLEKIIKHTPDIVDVLNDNNPLTSAKFNLNRSSFTPSQIIYYGVPGCGKSNRIREDLKNVPEKNKIRVVFHPEYTNAEFIGQILPKVNGHVTYEFTPGPFTQIIKRAYLNPNEQFYLVIEEINRGNAAAIFGDTFQLLDRLKAGETDSLGNDPANASVNTFTEGWSQYFVQNDDVNAYIRGNENSIQIGNIRFDSNTAIRLPPNLSILATMNTSDQNVFTLDNAFQRRFDMELVRNEFELATKDVDKSKYGGFKTADIQTQHDAKIADTAVKWGDFWEWINKKIVSTLKGLSSTEDKRLGVWFVSNIDGKIEEKIFAEKVLKYLWDDVFKFKRPQVFASEIDTLENLIAAFGKSRFAVFKEALNSSSSIAESSQNEGAANQ